MTKRSQFEGGELGEGQGAERFSSPQNTQAQEALRESEDAHGLDIEALRNEFRPFLVKRLGTIYNQSVITPEFLSGDIRIEKPEMTHYVPNDDTFEKPSLGALTLNPETQNIDWSRVPDSAYVALELGDDFNNQLAGTALQQAASSPRIRAPHDLDEYEFLGIEFWKWLVEQGIPKGKVPTVLNSVPFVLAGSRITTNLGWEVPLLSKKGAGRIGESLWAERLLSLTGNTWSHELYIALVRKSALEEARLPK